MGKFKAYPSVPNHQEANKLQKRPPKLKIYFHNLPSIIKFTLFVIFSLNLFEFVKWNSNTRGKTI